MLNYNLKVNFFDQEIDNTKFSTVSFYYTV